MDHARNFYFLFFLLLLLFFWHFHVFVVEVMLCTPQIQIWLLHLKYVDLMIISPRMQSTFVTHAPSLVAVDNYSVHPYCVPITLEGWRMVKSETRQDAEILVRNPSPRLFGKKFRDEILTSWQNFPRATFFEVPFATPP